MRCSATFLFMWELTWDVVLLLIALSLVIVATVWVVWVATRQRSKIIITVAKVVAISFVGVVALVCCVIAYYTWLIF